MSLSYIDQWNQIKREVKSSSTTKLKRELQRSDINAEYKQTLRRELTRRGAYTPTRRQSPNPFGHFGTFRF